MQFSTEDDTAPDQDEDIRSVDGDTIVLEGAISIEAALRGRSRAIHRILIRADKAGREIDRIERQASQQVIPVDRVDDSRIDELAAAKSHGGIVALAGPRRFVDLADLGPGAQSWIAMIDGVEDPYNFGAAVRSLHAAGAAGLVVRPRNWFTAAGLVARSSAGASELLPTAIADTAEDAAAHFRARGFIVACADEQGDAATLYDADLTRPLFLLIGGEKRGITRSFRDKADLLLRIPYGAGSAHSLGTAAATAVIAFEILRQRRTGPQPARAPDAAKRRRW